MIEIGDLLISKLWYGRIHLVFAIKKYDEEDVGNRDFGFFLYDVKEKRNVLRVKYQDQSWKDWINIHEPRIIRHGKDISDSICDQLDGGEQK